MPAPRAHHLRDRGVDDVPEAELITARLGDRIVRTVFLDRDGTLNVKAAEGAYVRRPCDVRLLPGAARAVARLNAAGLRTVLVTNQRWMSGTGARAADHDATQRRLAELLAAEGGRWDAAYVCPHAAGSCDCRKPAPGLLRRAARELGADLAEAVMVGDAPADVQAGRAAGTATIMIGVSGAVSGPAHRLADAVAPDLARAVDLLIPPGT